MTLAILDELRAIGVEVIPEGESLVIRPASKVPAELKARLKAAKAEVLAALARPTVAVQSAECRHCNGKGVCACPACTLRRTEKAVPCPMCRWQERQLWLAATRPNECWHCEERRLNGQSGPCSLCASKTLATVS